MRPATCFIALTCAAEPTRDTDKPDRNCRADALIKQIRLQINLAVGDGNHVRRDVSRNVARLRFDDRQRRQRAVAVFLADARRAFEQAAVQIKHVARICLAARRTLEHQRNLAISHGVLGKIVVNDQRVHAVVHEPLAHRRAGKRREILVGGRIGRGGHDDNRVRHRAGLVQHGDDARHVRLFLADGDVNAIQRAIILVSGLLRREVDAAPVDDGVDADGRLARRTVADDQFALAAADRNHRVNRHDAGLHRLADRICA